MTDKVICLLSGYGFKIQYEHGDGRRCHPPGIKLDVDLKNWMQPHGGHNVIQYVCE